jgi:hypothetical protein
MYEVYCPVCGAVTKETYVNLVPDDCDEWHGTSGYNKYRCPNCKGVKTDDQYGYDLEWKIPKKYPKTVTEAQLSYLAYLYKNEHIPYAHTKEVADMLIKKRLAVIKQRQYELEKKQAFEDELLKHKINPHYTVNSKFFIEYEDSILYINIDKVKYLASNPVILPKTSEFNTLKLDKMTEDFKNLNKDLQLLKERYND